MSDTHVFHVDVFATRPLTGNGLTVFLHTEGWSADAMQRMTQEMKQFESIFLSEISAAGARARVFTVEEELPFAGHPVLGAAAVLHRTLAPDATQGDWVIRLAAGDIPVTTVKLGGHHRAEMNQGTAVFGAAVAPDDLQAILERLGLQAADLAPGLPPQVVSTGLPYLILPVSAPALSRAAINGPDVEALLAVIGAKFLLVLDAVGRELRTWDNLGKVEDVATGSAAGPTAAYLYRLGLADAGQTIEIAQGRFAGRPSRLSARQDAQGSVLVSGEVWPVMQGSLDPVARDPLQRSDGAANRRSMSSGVL